MKQLQDQLGQALTATDIAEYTGLDVKTIRKYYRDLGGIRVGSRIVNDHLNRATHDRRNGASGKRRKSGSRIRPQLSFFTPFQS